MQYDSELWMLSTEYEAEAEDARGPAWFERECNILWLVNAVPYSRPFPSPSPSLSPSPLTTSQTSTVFAVAPAAFCSRSFSVLSCATEPHDVHRGAPTLPYIVVQDARPPTRLRNCRDKNISLAGTRRTQFFFGGVLHFSFSLSLHYKSVKSNPSQPTSSHHRNSRFSSHLSRPFYFCCSILCIKIVPYSLNPIILFFFF